VLLLDEDPSPAFDGHHTFPLASYKTLARIDEELTAVSAVLVTFSLGAYELYSGEDKLVSKYVYHLGL